MKKTIIAAFIAAAVLLAFSVLSLYITVWLFPKLAEQYYSSKFNSQSDRYMLFYVHPLVIGFALSWFWNRYKGVLTGSFITRGIEFGLIYTGIAIVPMMFLIYSAISVSISMVATWLLFGLLQGVIAGLVFEKANP